MAKNLEPKIVERYLNQNPEFIDNWLSRRNHKKFNDKFKKPSDFSSFVEKMMDKKKKETHKMIEFAATENELFRDLVKDIAHEINVSALSHKILQNIIKLTQCDRGSLFLVEGTEDMKYLVSKLFDVTSTSLLDETVHEEENVIRIPFGKGIVGYVAETKENMNIKDAYNDPRFNKEVDQMTGYRTKCLLCMPILNYDNKVVGVAQIMNKLDGNYFTEEDEKLFNDYLFFCGVGLNNAHLFEVSVEEYKRNQLLLNLAKDISSTQSNIQDLVEIILTYAMEILHCKSVVVYLLDIETRDTGNERFLNIYQLDDGKIQDITGKQDSIYIKVAIQSIRSDDNLVITNIQLDNQFANEDLTNIDARWILSTVLTDPSEQKIGCILFTRSSYETFRDVDVNTMQAFGLFCGLGLHNCQVCKSTITCLAQQQVAMDILSIHTTVGKEELDRFLEMEMLTPRKYRIYEFDFNDLLYSDETIVQICVLMFLEMNVLKVLGIDIRSLYRWTLTVKKNYRPVIYHNWRHGLNVLQTMFCMLTTGGMKHYFSDFEVIALLVAALCHDLDHRGTNNAYQIKTASALATIYSSSTLEHHHFDCCLMIINSESTNIFYNISSEDYKRALLIIEKAILSTDLCFYFKNRNLFEELINNGETLFETLEKKDLLISMIMTCCDLSAITKPWNHQKKVALMVADEFFEQGDLEKNVLQLEVIAMMDRDKRHDIPKLQVGFIDFVCKCVYESMSKLNDKLAPLYEGCMRNRTHWQNIADGKEKFDIDIELKKTRAGFFEFDEPETESPEPSKSLSPVLTESPSTPSVKELVTAPVPTRQLPMCPQEIQPPVPVVEVVPYETRPSMSPVQTKDESALEKSVYSLSEEIIPSLSEKVISSSLEKEIHVKQTSTTPLEKMSSILTKKTPTISLVSELESSNLESSALASSESDFEEKEKNEEEGEEKEGSGKEKSEHGLEIRKSFKQPSYSTLPRTDRRKSFMDELAEENLNHLEKKFQRTKTKAEEVPQIIKRTSHNVIPSHPDKPQRTLSVHFRKADKKDTGKTDDIASEVSRTREEKKENQNDNLLNGKTVADRHQFNRERKRTCIKKKPVEVPKEKTNQSSVCVIA